MPLTFTDTSFLPRSLTASFDGVSTKGSLKGFKFDPDALAYFARVEGVNGDNQPLEFAVKVAINDFVVGCKADGIWNAIKSSCIMAGARTLSGALQPLVGPAPTNFNFVSEDYNRKTGLVGNGTSKYLNSNRNNNADPQNSFHQSVYRSTSESRNVTRGATGNLPGAGGNSTLLTTTNARIFRCRDFGGGISDTTTTPGFWGASRSSDTTVIARYAGANNTLTINSATLSAGDLAIFRRGNDFTDARIAFYSIGEAINLAQLDTRVSNLMTAIGAAIP